MFLCVIFITADKFYNSKMHFVLSFTGGIFVHINVDNLTVSLNKGIFILIFFPLISLSFVQFVVSPDFIGLLLLEYMELYYTHDIPHNLDPYC